MSTVDHSPNICLEKPSLENLPPVLLPGGYSIRSIGIEEGYLWERVMDQSYGNYEPGTFNYIMVENYDYDDDRVFIMFDDKGEPCATATSWRQHYRWGDGVGYVLFVGVAKSHQGRALGYQMCLHILHDFVKHGLSPAILQTNDQNVPAIKTYLKLGFVPRIVHKDQYERWDNIFSKLGIEPPTYSKECRPYKDVPHPPKPYPYELKQRALKGR